MFFSERNSRPELATQFVLLTFLMKVLKERLTSWKKRNEIRLISLLTRDFFNQLKWILCLLNHDVLNFPALSTGHVVLNHTAYMYLQLYLTSFPALPSSFSEFAPSTNCIFCRAFFRLHGFSFPVLVLRRDTCCYFLYASFLECVCFCVFFLLFPRLPLVK